MCRCSACLIMLPITEVILSVNEAGQRVKMTVMLMALEKAR